MKTWTFYKIGLILSATAVLLAMYCDFRLSGGEFGPGVMVALVTAAFAVAAWFCFRSAFRSTDPATASTAKLAKAVAIVWVLICLGVVCFFRWKSANRELNWTKEQLASELEQVERGDRSPTSGDLDKMEQKIRESGVWAPSAEKAAAMEQLARLRQATTDAREKQPR